MTSLATLDRTTPASTVHVHRWTAARLSLCVASLVVGTVLVIRAYSIARTTTNLDYVTIFWVGYVAALAGLFGLGLISRRRSSGFAVAIALGIWTYLPKFLMSLHGPVYFDEWGHFRHLEDLDATGNIFNSNSFLPIVKYFPGLSLVTYAVQIVTRTSAWTAAVLTSLLAHTATAAAVYRIAERIGLSARRSVFATLLYAVGPTFTFFDAQYGYETLGLALAFWTIASVLGMINLSISPLPRGRPDSPDAGHKRQPKGQFARRSLPTVTLGVCTVFTHHLSALFTCAMLILMLILTGRVVLTPHRRAVLTGVVAICVAAAVLWIGVIANSAGYLMPKVTSGFQQLLQIVGLVGSSGSNTGPAERTALSTTAVPRYEIVSGYASIVLLVLAYGAALIVLWRCTRRDHGVHIRYRWCFALLGVFFFLSFPLILTSTGAEIAHRSWAFSWLGLATTLAATPLPIWTKRVSKVTTAIGGCVLVVVAIGMAVDGTNAAQRFPGPYKFGIDGRTQNPDEYRLARWFDSTGRHGGVITDRFTGTVLTGYTRLDVPAPTQQQLYRVFTEPLHIPEDVTNVMRRSNHLYFVVDSNFMGRLHMTEGWYPGSDSYYPLQQHELVTLIKRRGSAQLKLIKQIGHYYVFKLS